MRRARSSIRWSINGALVASMSSWLIPPRFSGRRAPRARPPTRPAQPPRRVPLRSEQSRAWRFPARRSRARPALKRAASEAAASTAPVEVEAAFVTSSRTMATGSKLVSIFAWSLIAWNSFFTLSRSASRSTSRMASMNWPWNSAAIRRIFPTVCPTVRITRGRSFGGITAKATMATMIILLMSKSNMAHRATRPNNVEQRRAAIAAGGRSR